MKYVMTDLIPFLYWTLWMSKSHTVSLHHVIIMYNDLINPMEGMTRAMTERKTQWKEYLYFPLKIAHQKHSESYAEVTPMSSQHLISGHIDDPVWMLRSFRKWDNKMDCNPEDEISYITQNQEFFLAYVANEYCTKHQ
jgi:hypothetical protein